MDITDAQVHVWAANSKERPWTRDGIGREHLPEPLGPDDLLSIMDRAGVQRCILVPPAWDGIRNDVALAGAVAHPERLGVMGILDVRDQASIDVANWLAQPGMLGIRLIFTRSGPEWFSRFGFREQLTDGTAEWLFDAAERYQVPIMIFSPGQCGAIRMVARRHPGLRLIVDHLNLLSSLRDEELVPEIDQLLPLAGEANIAIKVSALPCYVTESFPFPFLRSQIRRVIETFGPQRCIWGSDMTRLPCSYSDWIDASIEAIDFLPTSDRQLVMGGTLANWLRWPT